MAYTELVKNFNRIRDYMREFYVYGFKSREEYTRKSARSYDDERRRIERLDGIHYKITVNYDKDDETEIVIRILSFGPMIKVVAPEHFENLIKERLIKQKSCGL